MTTVVRGHHGMIDSGLRNRLDDADRRLAELRGYL
jgi:hypothetical protein